MKKLSVTLILLVPFFVFGQAPLGLNYQAIAWDNNNLPKQNKLLTVTFNILEGKADGPIEFTETRPVTTNTQGLFTTTIGSLYPEKFKTINWATGTKFLQVIIDGVASGTTQILSVPYALYAERTNLQAGEGIAVSGNSISNTGDKDNTNEIQTLGINGTQLSLSKGGGTVNLPSQQLSLNGNQLSLSNGGIVNLPKQASSYAEENGVQTMDIGENNLNPNVSVPENGTYLLLFSFDIKERGTSAFKLTTMYFYFQGKEIYGVNVFTSDDYKYTCMKVIQLNKGVDKINVFSPTFSSKLENISIYLQKIN